jgi:hypothetical protein
MLRVIFIALMTACILWLVHCIYDTLKTTLTVPRTVYFTTSTSDAETKRN